VNGKRVNAFDIRVRSELWENTRIDPGGDTVVSSLNAIKHSCVPAEAAETREHTLLCSLDSRHLRTGCTLSCGALLRISSAVTAIAQSLCIDYRRWLIEQLDHHIEFAGFRKVVLAFEIANGFVIGELRSIKSVRLSASDFIRLCE
jgi:hypothetical protein